jgi:hypothetical protein
LVLLQFDPDTCIRQLELMAASRKLSMRSSALYCLRQVPPGKAAPLVLEMFLKEEDATLARDEAALLEVIAGEKLLHRLVQKAHDDAVRAGLARSILEAIARRENWSSSELSRRLEQAQTEGEATVSVSSQRVPEKRSIQTDSRRPDRAPASAMAVLRQRPRVLVAALAVLCLAGLRSTMQGSRSEVEVIPETAGPAVPVEAKLPRVFTPREPPSGPMRWVTGNVRSVEGNSVILKQGYTYYYFEFDDAAELRSIAPGQKLKVQGRYQRWDSEAGAIRMSGITASPVS